MKKAFIPGVLDNVAEYLKVNKKNSPVYHTHIKYSADGGLTFTEGSREFKLQNIPNLIPVWRVDWNAIGEWRDGKKSDTPGRVRSRLGSEIQIGPGTYTVTWRKVSGFELGVNIEVLGKNFEYLRSISEILEPGETIEIRQGEYYLNIWFRDIHDREVSLGTMILAEPRIYGKGLDMTGRNLVNISESDIWKPVGIGGTKLTIYPGTREIRSVSEGSRHKIGNLLSGYVWSKDQKFVVRGKIRVPSGGGQGVSLKFCDLLGHDPVSPRVSGSYQDFQASFIVPYQGTVSGGNQTGTLEFINPNVPEIWIKDLQVFPGEAPGRLGDYITPRGWDLGFGDIQAPTGHVGILRTIEGNPPKDTGAYTWIPISEVPEADLPGGPALEDVPGEEVFWHIRFSDDCDTFTGIDPILEQEWARENPDSFESGMLEGTIPGKFMGIYRGTSKYETSVDPSDYEWTKVDESPEILDTELIGSAIFISDMAGHVLLGNPGEGIVLIDGYPHGHNTWWVRTTSGGLKHGKSGMFLGYDPIQKNLRLSDQEVPVDFIKSVLPGPGKVVGIIFDKTWALTQDLGLVPKIFVDATDLTRFQIQETAGPEIEAVQYSVDKKVWTDIREKESEYFRTKSKILGVWGPAVRLGLPGTDYIVRYSENGVTPTPASPEYLDKVCMNLTAPKDGQNPLVEGDINETTGELIDASGRVRSKDPIELQPGETYEWGINGKSGRYEISVIALKKEGRTFSRHIGTYTSEYFTFSLTNLEDAVMYAIRDKTGDSPGVGTGNYLVLPLVNWKNIFSLNQSNRFGYFRRIDSNPTTLPGVREIMTTAINNPSRVIKLGTYNQRLGITIEYTISGYIRIGPGSSLLGNPLSLRVMSSFDANWKVRPNLSTEYQYFEFSVETTGTYGSYPYYGYLDIDGAPTGTKVYLKDLGVYAGSGGYLPNPEDAAIGTTPGKYIGVIPKTEIPWTGSDLTSDYTWLGGVHEKIRRTRFAETLDGPWSDIRRPESEWFQILKSGTSDWDRPMRLDNLGSRYFVKYSDDGTTFTGKSEILQGDYGNLLVDGDLRGKNYSSQNSLSLVLQLTESGRNLKAGDLVTYTVKLGISPDLADIPLEIYNTADGYVTIGRLVHIKDGIYKYTGPWQTTDKYGVLTALNESVELYLPENFDGNEYTVSVEWASLVRGESVGLDYIPTLEEASIGTTPGRYIGGYFSDTVPSVKFSDYTWTPQLSDVAPEGGYEYYLSGSTSETTLGEWTTERPTTWVPGRYLWVRPKGTSGPGTLEKSWIPAGRLPFTGGNLILSGDELRVNSDYLSGTYGFSQDGLGLAPGDKITVAIKYYPGIEKDLHLVINDEDLSFGGGSINYMGNGIYTCTHTVPRSQRLDQGISVYSAPQEHPKQNSTSTIEWIKVVRGETITLEYTPAMEEARARVDLVPPEDETVWLGVKNDSLLEASFTETSGVTGVSIDKTTGRVVATINT